MFLKFFDRKGQPPLAILMDFGSARPARKQIRSRSEALQLQICTMNGHLSIALHLLELRSYGIALAMQILMKELTSGHWVALCFVISFKSYDAS
ncbi:hypothetical protein AgCh_031784 [Apium graveolens]